MMNFIGLLITALFSLTNADTTHLEVVRANYDKVISDKKMCIEMIAELEKRKNNSPTHLVYLGGLQVILANHVFNPISKLNTFNEGKKNIVQAIKNEPDNA
jgi:hypothetical protein